MKGGNSRTGERKIWALVYENSLGKEEGSWKGNPCMSREKKGVQQEFFEKKDGNEMMKDRGVKQVSKKGGIQGLLSAGKRTGVSREEIWKGVLKAPE